MHFLWSKQLQVNKIFCSQGGFYLVVRLSPTISFLFLFSILTDFLISADVFFKLPYVSNVQVEPVVVQIDRLDLVLEENSDVDACRSSSR